MKRCCFLLLMLFAFRASAQMNSGKLITKNHYHEVPFTETKSEIRVKASLKGDEYDFMLDTGAPVFISTSLQKKYNYPILYKGKTQDAGGNMVGIVIVQIDTITFGPFIFTDVPAIVIDMETSPLECLHFSGNIGSNALRHLYVQFDHREQRVCFADNEKLLKKHFPTTYPMLLTRQSDAVMTVKLDNGFSDTLHFDSGDGSLYNMSQTGMDRYVAAYPGNAIRKGYGITNMGIGGVGNSFQQYVAKPGSITFGSTAITGGTITIAGNNRSRMGRDLLNYGTLQLNYPDSTYAFDGYTAPFTKDRYDYGFIIVIDDDKMIAGCVWENSGAAQQGMQPGDRILKIDDKDLTEMPKCDIAIYSRELYATGPASITVTYRHKKQKPQTITLQRKTL